MRYPIPDDIFKTHTVITGKTGSGKSVTLAGMVERLFVLKKRVCVIEYQSGGMVRAKNLLFPENR